MSASPTFLTMRPEARRVELADGQVGHVRMLTVGERVQLERALADNAGRAVHSLILRFALADETGAPVFAADDPAALDVLDGLPGPWADRLLAAATDLNALGAKAVDEAAKN